MGEKDNTYGMIFVDETPYRELYRVTTLNEPVEIEESNMAKKFAEDVEKIYSELMEEKTMGTMNDLKKLTQDELNYLYLTSIPGSIVEIEAKKELDRRKDERLKYEKNCVNYSRYYGITPRNSGRYPWNDNRRFIENVIFNAPATIVFWSDGSKTVVKCGEDDVYDPEKGLAMAFSKKFMGNKGNFNEVFKKWLPKEEIKSGMIEEVYLTVAEFAELKKTSVSTMRKQFASGKYKNAEKIDGKWMIKVPTKDLKG